LTFFSVMWSGNFKNGISEQSVKDEQGPDTNHRNHIHSEHWFIRSTAYSDPLGPVTFRPAGSRPVT
jgi:hypothetical protein